jgi:hypothetical protein
MAASIVALPFEMVISILRSQIVLHVGSIGYFFHPALGVAIGAIGLLRGRRLTPWRSSLLIWLAVYTFGVVLSALVNHALPFYAVSFLLLGPVLMALVLVLLLERNDLVDSLLAAFVIGQAVWAACFLVLSILNASMFAAIYPDIEMKSLGSTVLALRGDETLWRSMLYYKLLGNFNKQANLLVLGLLMAGYLLVRGRVTWLIWLASSASMAAMLVLMFSRGAFVAIAAASLVLLATGRGSRRQTAVAVLLGLLFMGSFATPEWRNYWFNERSLVQREEMASAALTAAPAFKNDGELAPAVPATPTELAPRQAPPSEAPPVAAGPESDGDQRNTGTDGLCQAKRPDRSISFFVFGYGIGNYGPTICRIPAAESHNTFLDAWIHGGLIGAIGYVMLFVVAALEAARRVWRSRLHDTQALFGLALIMTIAILSLREYALVYLWVQSAGGFALAVGLALCATRPQEST